MDLGPNATTIAIDFPGTQTSESRRRKLLSAACQFVPLKLRKRDCKRIGIYRPVHAPGPQRMSVLVRVPMMAVLSLTGRFRRLIQTVAFSEIISNTPMVSRYADSTNWSAKTSACWPTMFSSRPSTACDLAKMETMAEQLTAWKLFF